MKELRYKDEYPDFELPAASLSKFIAAGDIFTILLKNGEIIHYTADDPESFRQWLTGHRIIDIKFERN